MKRIHLKKIFIISAAVLILTQVVFLLSSVNFTLATNTTGANIINTPIAPTVDSTYTPPPLVAPVTDATTEPITSTSPTAPTTDSNNILMTDQISPILAPATPTTTDTQNSSSTTASSLSATTTANHESIKTSSTTTTNLLATTTPATTATTTKSTITATTTNILTDGSSLYPSLASSTQIIIKPIATTTSGYVKPATTTIVSSSTTTTKTTSESTKTTITADSTKTSETKDSPTSSTIKPLTDTPKNTSALSDPSSTLNNTDTASSSEKDKNKIIPEPVDRKKMDIVINSFSSIIPFSYEKENNNLVIIKAQGAEPANAPSQTEESKADLVVPAIIIFDADGDGLTDEIEKRLNTNPGLADTDGDGYSDNEEILNGYNPLGSGKSEKILEPAEEAIARKVVIDQPKISETARLSKKFKVLKVENTGASSTGQSIAKNSLKFTGLAEPNSVVTLFIYSAMPIVITVNTDANGNWVYELDKTLVDGKHEAYVVINDAQGKISEKSSPFSFLINKAQAVSNPIELPKADIDIPDQTNKIIVWYAIGGLGLVLITLVTFFTFTKFNKKY